jgi:hypothetical protein
MFGTLVAFRVFKSAGQKGADMLCKQFYGQYTTTRGKRYRRRGLLDQTPHVRLIRGVIIVSTRDAKEVIRFLRKFNAEIHVRKVELTHKDKKILQG